MLNDKSPAPGTPLPGASGPQAPASPASPDPVNPGPAQLPGVSPRRVDARAMKAFAHPLRMAIYAHLTDTGSATATALARHLHESTGQTSYHLRQLEKHGFVEEDTGRGTGRERWWKPVGFSVPTYDLAQDEANKPAIQAMLQASLDQRARALARWLSVETSEDPAWIQASVDNTSTQDLTAAQARAMTEELMSVIERYMRSPADQPGTTSGATGTDEAGPASGPGEDEGEGEDEGKDAAPTRRVRLYLSVFPLPDGDADGDTQG
ncbi:MAG TPA: helix-turn-helix domain-containing protein [Citricoccus sp.]